jgi:HSP20 family protein
MSLIRWNPVRDMNLMSRTFNELFSSFDNLLGQTSAGISGVMPRVDISDDKQHLYVLAELPGMKAEDVKVTVSDGILTLRGEKKREEVEQQRNFYRSERMYGEFVRQFALPEGVDAEQIEATCEDGVLEIRIPKVEVHDPNVKEIPVTSKKTEGRLSSTAHINQQGRLDSATQANGKQATNRVKETA